MIKSFSYVERAESLKKIPQTCFDLAIVGGGINGAGVARDAASRGMSVVVVEANDFAFGTSSRSSKLIHGGLRYLENFEFGLVFEALSEKRWLFELAPHLIHPLRFLVPIYKNSRVGMFKMGLGMWCYDVLSLFEALQMHEKLSPEASLQRQPALCREDLLGSYVYSDAYTDDDRLVIETLRSANDWGASCLSYMSVVEPIKKKEKVVGLKCVDRWKGGTYNIYAKHIVSTVGPWTDDLASQFFNEWQPMLCLSKGIHLTVSRERLPMKEAVVLAAQDSARIIFIIPRHDMVMIGTTDTDFKGDPCEAVALAEDVSYLLGIVNSYFPSVRLNVEDIISSYAGVRPLVDDKASIHSEVSREHTILRLPQNITFVMGGKYTTYRKIAQEVMEMVLEGFDLENRAKFCRSKTKQPINPDAQGEGRVEELAQEFNIPLSEIKELVNRHGGETHSLLKKWLVPQTSMKPSLFVEIHHAINNMMCLNLEDFYLRRMPLFVSQKDHGWEYVEEVACIFSDYFHWDSRQRQEQINSLKETISREMEWKNRF